MVTTAFEVCGWLLAVVLIQLEISPAPPQVERRFVFRYEVELRDLPSQAQQVDVWLPVPSDTSEQRVISVEIFSPVEGQIKREGTYGNRVWHARFTRPGTLRVVQRVEVIRKVQRIDRQPAAIPQGENLELFLKSNRLVPVDGRFERIAREQTSAASEVMAKTRALYNYVLNRMTYDKSGSGWGQGDANYACDIGKGNCSDYHSLFIALCRSVSLPARFWIGFPLPAERGRGPVAGYHCWAEFWVPGLGWVPVDISKADKQPHRSGDFFGTVDENRIAYTLGRDLVLPPGQRGPPVNFFIYPHVEVDGARWDLVECRFSYEDLP